MCEKHRAFLEQWRRRRAAVLAIEDARLEKVASVEALRAVLRRHYLDLTDDAIIDVVQFQLEREPEPGAV
jgi:hypothetical protein